MTPLRRISFGRLSRSLRACCLLQFECVADVCPCPIMVLLLTIVALQRQRMERISHFALGWVIARTKFYDNAILERAADFEQFVILGAGFDCRAYRLALPDSLDVFEVDRPETQAYKRERIRDARSNPVVAQRLNRVKFVPVNFNTQKLEDQLPESGYSTSKRTLFLWEAVTQYITPEAVDSVLAFIKSSSGAGSVVCFDFKYKEAVEGKKSYAGIGLKTFVGQENEPYIFGVPEGETSAFLSARGFALQRQVKPAELQKLIRHSEGAFYTLPGFQEIVIAGIE